MTAKALKYQEARVIKMPLEPSKKLFINPKKLLIPLSNRTVSVNICDILFCKSESNYTHIHLSDGTKILTSKCLKYYQEILTDRSFIRCHASYLANLDRVSAMTEGNTILEIDKYQIPISRSRKKQVKSIFRN